MNPTSAGRTLVMITLEGSVAFAVNALRVGNRETGGIEREMLNALPVVADERGLPYPLLVEALPQFNTDSWRMFPDGTMETTYRLKPNLTYHDGAPLSAEDFVFAWRVYTTPTLPLAGTLPFGLMQEVTAPDARTFVIRWKASYPDAGTLGSGALSSFQALPRHILEEPFRELGADAFVGHPFWTDGYIGLGPYRLDRLDPGVSVEATGFAGYVLGRPKIDRVRVLYLSDTNTIIANLLSGTAQYSNGLRGEEGQTLMREWSARNGGTVLWEAVSNRHIQIQLRPEFAVPTQLATDVRVRRALAHTLDKETAFQVVTGGHGVLSDTFTHPSADYHEIVDRAVMKYPHDPRRAQQLLEEAGFVRGQDGFWTSPTGSRATLEVWFTDSATNQRESLIFVDALSRTGIDASSQRFDQSGSNEMRSKVSGVFPGAGAQNLLTFRTKNIPRLETRWAGQNRIGYANPEFDRLADAFDVSLERAERIQLTAHMERIISEDLPAVFLYYTPHAIAHLAAIKGPIRRLTPEAGPGLRNIHEWEWTS